MLLYAWQSTQQIYRRAQYGLTEGIVLLNYVEVLNVIYDIFLD